MLSQFTQPELSYERLRLLLEINNTIVTNLDVRQLLHAISETLQKCVPHDFTALAVYDEEKQELRAHSIETFGKGAVAEGMLLPMDGSFAEVAIKSRQTLLRKTIDLAEFSAPIVRQGVESIGLRSACVVPLILHDRILGAVTLASKTEAAFRRSGISVPLISHNNVLGTINVGSLKEAAFTKHEAEFGIK